MKFLLALYFFILATIQLGLLLGIYRYYRGRNQSKPSLYWLGSLAVSFLALAVFGAGILVNQSGAARPEFNFTIANTLFYIAAVLQLLFCHSLNREISRPLKITAIGSIGAFLAIFEVMRIYGTFELRTIFMCVLVIIFYAWQILQIRKKRKSTPSLQLSYLQYVTGVEIAFALARILTLLMSSLSINQVDQIPQVLVFFTIGQIVMNTLSYIAISSYWTEEMVMSNTRATIENQEIKTLLQERDNLISSLLRANKTAATGALSASIAHELNQPLGASQLNIQFLQKKLATGDVDRAQYEEVLSALLTDNQRAASIIQSLRSIFSDEKISIELLDSSEVIHSVLKIAKSEIQAKQIHVALNLSASTLVNMNRSEMQQVVLNLINNAIQALLATSESQKILSIESRDVTDGIEITVSDNGSGVCRADQTQLFQLLSSNNKKAGMGLGLWLCQHIVARHSGRICYQDAPGGGAQFIIFLPQEH